MVLSASAGISILIAALLLIVAALWLSLKRMRRWKEQILHAIAVLESNSHQARMVMRDETVAMLDDKLRWELHEGDERLNRELTPIREDLRALREQMSLRALVASQAATPRLQETPAPNTRYGEYLDFLQSLDHATEGSRVYLSIHQHRTARTLAAVPPPANTGRALELGAYGFMASALGCVAGYREVRCSYLGAAGQNLSRPVPSRGKEIFRCEYDLFDAERDPFPYPDGHFDLVLACEIIEHLTRDPMHMLLECGRVLADGGTLLVTTPNVASHSSIARVLTASGNPQMYSQYAHPSGETESPHVREYTPGELRETVLAAGFVMEYLFTEKIDGCDADTWVAGLLRDLDLPDALRGEQIYCVARKRSGATITRYPSFLYEGRPW
jgi:SAM-dependent methyltransferase